jgi:hypothetical protein
MKQFSTARPTVVCGAACIFPLQIRGPVFCMGEGEKH